MYSYFGGTTPVARAGLLKETEASRINDLRFPRGICQVPQGELTREHSQQAIFFTLHYAAADRRQILVADQVQDAVDEVTDQLGLPRGAKLSRLLHRVVDADENFSVESFRKVRGTASHRP